MRNETSTPRKERHRCVSQTAARQWGCITTGQLRAFGISEATQDRWVKAGLLLRLHRGVWVYGPISPAPEQRWMAALLATGDGSALSHTTAAAVHGLIAVRAVTEVVGSSRRRGDERLRVRQATGETTVVRGLRVTTVAQTLLDLAAIRWPIDRLLNDALGASLVPLDDLKAFALDHRGRRGAKALLTAVGLPHARSGWEREFLRWIRRLDGIPLPILNDRIGRLTVDLHWPEHRLVVELDTDQTHGTPWRSGATRAATRTCGAGARRCAASGARRSTRRRPRRCCGR